MKHTAVALYAFMLLFGYLSYLVLQPFLTYVILALLFAVLFHPIYHILQPRMPKRIATLVVLLIVLLCIVLPSAYFGATLFVELSGAYQATRDAGISVFDQTSIANWIAQTFGVDVRSELQEIITQGAAVVTNALPGIITGTGAVLLGMFIMFLILYYALQDGPVWLQRGISLLPLKKNHRKQLFEKVKKETRALLYGQIVTSIFIGVLNGLVLWAAGIPNAVFWAFLMIIIGIIPVVGAFLVYIPAGIYLLVQQHWIPGIGVLVLCTAIHLFIDYIVRPKMISDAAQIHPIFVILGALGGIALMGVVGFLIGPLVLSFFITLLSFDYEN
ncbi:MAG: AI-2E family transporter [Candidatus Woesearchaeota archaeon]|nr:AI-2E family transporter [Candidatus Woesearchaeota archaeon]